MTYLASYLTESGPSKIDLLISIALLLIAILGITDLILDAPVSRLGLHILVEIVLLGLSLGLSVFLAARHRIASRRLVRTKASLDAHRAELVAWRTRAEAALRGLGAQIDDQLRLWELTITEREVAMFLLKGFSHKEIAGLTKKSERTVRQQAVTAYRKSGLSGRAELSAFFLEDLLPPTEEPAVDLG